jgi:hypothetical protein
VVPQRGNSFLGGVSSYFLGHFHGILGIYRAPQLKPSRLPPFLSKLGKRVGLWTCTMTEAHALGCRPRGESS